MRGARGQIALIGALIAAVLVPAAAAASPPANPKVTAVTVSPETVSPGGEFGATATFENRRQKATKRRSMLFRIFPAEGGTGRTLATRQIPKIKPRSSVEIAASLTLNPGKKLGAYDVVACRTPRKNKKRCGKRRVRTPLTVIAPPEPPELQVTPTSSDFGLQDVNSTSAPRSFTVTNIGEADSGELSTDVGGDASQFAIAADDCDGSELSGGETCTVGVSFAPDARGEASAILRVAAGPGEDATATLSGVGRGPAALTITPAVYDFGSVSNGGFTDYHEFTVENAGDLPSSAISFSVGGADSSQFRAFGDCGGVTLAPGATCHIDVILQPTSMGDKTASLDVAAADGGPASAQLSGTATPGPHLTITPDVPLWELGDVTIGTSAEKIFVVANDGQTDAFINGTGSALGAGITVVNNTCGIGTTIPAGANCQFTLRFTPTSEGPRSGSYSLQARPGGRVEAAVRGNGVSP